MHLFKTIKRIFDRHWLDPRSQFVGDGGAVDIGDLSEHLRRASRRWAGRAGPVVRA